MSDVQTPEFPESPNRWWPESPNHISPLVEFPVSPNRWWPESRNQIFPYDSGFLLGDCPSTSDLRLSPDDAINNCPTPELTGSDMLRDDTQRWKNLHKTYADLVSSSLKHLFSSLEPILRKVVLEEVRKALKQIKHGHAVYRVAPSEFPKQSGGSAQVVVSARLELGEEHIYDQECMMLENRSEEFQNFRKIEGFIYQNQHISLPQIESGKEIQYQRLDFTRMDVEHVSDDIDDAHGPNMYTTLGEPINLDQRAAEQHWDGRVNRTHVSRATVVELEHTELQRNGPIESVDVSKSKNGTAFSGKQDMSKTLKGNSRILEIYSGHTSTSEAVCTLDSEKAMELSRKQDPTAVKRDETGKTMNSPQSANAVAFSKRKAPERRCGISGRIIIDLDVVKQYFHLKLEDAAATLGVSRSTLKRICRQNDIFRWPSNKQPKLFDRNESEKDINLILHPNAGSSIWQTNEGDHLTVSNDHLHSEDTSTLPDSTEGSSRYNTKTAVCRKRKFTDTGLERARGDQPGEISHVNTGPSGQNLTIKAVYGEDIIRFDLCSTSGIFKLKEEVSKRLRLDTSSFDIKYLDNDKDWILIRCEEDLKQCVAICSQQDSKPIRLQIRKT